MSYRSRARVGAGPPDPRLAVNVTFCVFNVSRPVELVIAGLIGQVLPVDHARAGVGVGDIHDQTRVLDRGHAVQRVITVGPHAAVGVCYGPQSATGIIGVLNLSPDIVRCRLDATQEFLSQMLGTRRSSVSVAASSLERAGLIHQNRGHVSIINRAELENACCECYGVIQQQLQRWGKELVQDSPP
jgi:hypothetical protein